MQRMFLKSDGEMLIVLCGTCSLKQLPIFAYLTHTFLSTATTPFFSFLSQCLLLFVHVFQPHLTLEHRVQKSLAIFNFSSLS